MYKIICDTNIWYAIAKGEVSAIEIKKLPLIGTFNNMNELLHSMRIISDPVLVKAAIKALLLYAKEIIIHNPFYYLLELDGQVSFVKNKQGINYLNEIKRISAMEGKEYILEVQSPAFINNLRQKNASLHQSTEEINQGILQFVNKYWRKPSRKKNHRKDDPLPAVKSFINFSLNLNTGVNLDESFKWNKIELLTNVLGEYFKDLELSPNPKIDQNDWIDFYNLVYVTEGTEFWTFENKWLNYIKNYNSGKYLFHSHHE